MTKKQTSKPNWLYDKQGNIREVHKPVNGKGETISIKPKTLTGGLHGSVGFSAGSNSMYADHNAGLHEDRQ